MEYEIRYDRFGKPGCIYRFRDGACIPLSEDNSDFREFLRWNEEHKNIIDWKNPSNEGMST